MNKQIVPAELLRDVRRSCAVHAQRPVHHWHCISGQKSFGDRFRNIGPEAQALQGSVQTPGMLREMALQEVEVERRCFEALFAVNQLALSGRIST